MPRPAESFFVIALRASGLTLLLVALVAVWVWRLYPGPPPSDPTIQARVQALTDLGAYVAQAPDAMRLPAIMALAWLPDATLQDLLDWRHEPADRQVRLLTVQAGPVEPGPLHDGLLFAALNSSNWASLEGTHLMISASGERLTTERKIEALRLLSTKALSANQHEPAMEILQRAIHVAPGQWDLVLEAVSTCRQAARPDLALTLLSERMSDAQHPLSETETQQALDLELALMIRAGRSREALALAEERFERGQNDAHAIERFANAASFSGLPARALPALDQFLASQAPHSLNPNELIVQDSVHADYRRALELHARLADEAGDSRRSRDSLLRLAALGDMRFIGRLRDLCRNDPRDQAWETLLTQLPDPCTAAKMAQAAGHDAAAREILAAFLKTDPTHRDAAFLLTMIDSDHAADATARLRLWETYGRSHPTDTAGVLQLASAYEATGQAGLALRTLSALGEQEHIAESLKTLHRLALHQRDLSTALKAKKALLELQRDASPADYLRLAQLQHSGTENATSHEGLLAGLDRFPDNALLREALHRETSPEIRPAEAIFATQAQ